MKLPNARKASERPDPSKGIVIVLYKKDSKAFRQVGEFDLMGDGDFELIGTNFDNEFEEVAQWCYLTDLDEAAIVERYEKAKHEAALLMWEELLVIKPNPTWQDYSVIQKVAEQQILTEMKAQQ